MNRFFGRFTLISWFVVWLLLAGTPPVRADYVVERGDVLSVTVAEEMKLGREMKVNADGRIMLPQLGSVAVAGRDLDGIRQLIERELVQRDIIRAPAVVVEVANYRPFYIGGAVTRPGAVGFEPGLTVRHAIVLAGGLDRSRYGSRLSNVELMEIKTRWRDSAYRLFQENSRIVRLQAELNFSGEADLSSLDTSLVAARDAQVILSLDSGLLHDRIQTWSADRSHLKSLIGLVDFELGVLAEQADLQEKEWTLQQELVENAQSLVSKGLAPLPRLQELKREASRISRDLLENNAFAARARQNRASAEYELASANTKWRIDAQSALREAVQNRARLETDMKLLRDTLISAGVSLDAEDAAADPIPEVVIHRKAGDRAEMIHATMDTEIEPGDILDVGIAKAPHS